MAIHRHNGVKSAAFAPQITPKSNKKHTFLHKNLEVSKISSTFAPFNSYSSWRNVRETAPEGGFFYAP